MDINTTFGCLIFVALTSLTCFQVNAQYFTPTISESLGGAGLASQDDAQSSLMNPASVVFGSQVSGVTYYKDVSSETGYGESVFGFTLLDNGPTTLFPGALTYLKRNRNFVVNPNVSEEYWELDVAELTQSGFFSLGLSGIYLRSRQEGFGGHSQWSWNVGAVYTPIPELGFGFVGKNLAVQGSDVPDEIRLNSSLGVGVTYYWLNQLEVRLDYNLQTRNNPDQEGSLHFGLESKLHELFLFRMGYENDHQNDVSHYSLGAGFEGPRLKADYVFKKSTGNERIQVHSVDLRLAF